MSLGLRRGEEAAMSDAKKWKAGTADAAWKINICARDAMRAEDLLHGIAYILTDSGTADLDQCAAALSELSGRQICEGLLAYRNKAIDAIRAGIGEENKAAVRPVEKQS